MNRLNMWGTLLGFSLIAGGAVAATIPNPPLISSILQIQDNASSEKIDKEFLNYWLSKIKSRPPAVSSKSEANYGTITLLEDLYSRLSSAEAIRTFRTWEKDDEAIQILVPFAASEIKPERFVATLTLANVVDNTNLCYVLNYLLLNREINANGRYNLLQIVRGVAGYAYDENDLWIRGTLNVVKEHIANLPAMEKTSDMIFQIQKILAARSNGRGSSIKALSEERFIKCEAMMKEAKLI